MYQFNSCCYHPPGSPPGQCRKFDPGGGELFYQFYPGGMGRDQKFQRIRGAKKAQKTRARKQQQKGATVCLILHYMYFV